MRFLSIPEGILYLEEHGWVEKMVREWKDNGRTTTYADSVDTKWNVSWTVSAGPCAGNARTLYPVPFCCNMLYLSTITDTEPTTSAFTDEYQRDGPR